ncbi:MAG: menaquinone biosynthesis protein [Thermogutta sp.]
MNGDLGKSPIDSYNRGFSPTSHDCLTPHSPHGFAIMPFLKDSRTSPDFPRVGGVCYLNAAPLLRNLTDYLPAENVVYDVPSRLADLLARGQLDIAIVPSFQAFRDPNSVVLSDACIAAQDVARSVILFSRTPLHQITTLALDAGSRSSAALVRILLAELYQVRPRTRELPLNEDLTKTADDAVLLIGDRAMVSRPDGFPHVWDVGAMWHDWTGLPFVFALWIARPGVNHAYWGPRFAAARDRGVAQIREIAVEAAENLGLPFPTCYDYLSRNLHFRLGEAEKTAVDRFGRLLAKHGFVPSGVELVYNSENSR